MKILLVDLQYEYGMKARGVNEISANGFVRVFKGLGHEVECFYYDDYLQRLDQLQLDLLAKARLVKPDLIYFHFFGEQFRPETLLALKKEFKTLNWFGDDQWRFDSFTKKMAPLLTYSITTDWFAKPKYLKMGYENVIVSQWAALENQDLLSAIAHPIKYEFDVSFVGGSNSTRRWFVNQLRKQGIAVACFGFGWPGGPVPMARMAEIFVRSRINLNLSNSNSYDIRYLLDNPKNPLVAWRSPKNSSQIKARNFEIPYFGGFQLADYVPSLERYLAIGKEVACYSNVDEAALLIRHYLNSESERLEVQKAGTGRARAEHTFTQRHKEIFAQIAQFK